MLNCVIVEDNRDERERLEHYIRQYCSENQQELKLTVFTDGKYLLDSYPPSPDLIFLDIDMEIMSGIETARRIRVFDSNVQILFVTRMVQFALEGYEVDAADFVVKPVPYPLFAARMNKVMKKIVSRRPRFLEIVTGREQRMLQVGQLVCAEALNKKTILHLADGTAPETGMPLYTLEQHLQGEPFFRCHNAFLVNLAYVRGFCSSQAQLPFGTVPVSKYRKKEFLQALADYRGTML